MRGGDKGVKEIGAHIIKLKDLDYNLLEIIMLQDEIHDKYAWKGKGEKEKEEDT